MSTDSTLTYGSNSILVFDGTYQKPYTVDAWSQDILKASAEYKSSLPYVSGIIRKPFAENWMLILLLFCFGSLAFVRGVFRKRFSMLFQTFINWKLSKQIIRYEKVYTHPVNLLLLLNFILCVPLFFTVSTLKYGHWELSAFRLFLFILIPLLAYLLIKFLLYQFSAWLMDEKEAIDEYIFQTNLFNKYLGVVFLLLASFIIYSAVPYQLIFYLGLSILIFFLAFQLVRGVIIGIQKSKSLHFIILYLCTLEILPWLILGKWLNNLQ